MGFDLASLFGLAKTPEQRNAEWRAKLRRMQRELDGQIRDIQRSTKTTEREIRQCASRNDHASCRALAKEIVSARSTVSRLYTSKAQMSSVERALAHQRASSRSVAAIERSSEVLRAMNAIARTAAVRDDARELGREMCKAGVIAEMVEDALDLDDVENEEETECAIEDVLREIAGEVTLPEAVKETPSVEVRRETSGETTTADLKARLAAMREEA